MFFRVFPVLILSSTLLAAATDATRQVNVFIGTGGHGHTYPGATVPHGMVQLSPDTYNFGWDWCSGYHYSDSSIMGFSHNHLSGTGIGDLLDVLIMPGTGPAKIVPGSRENPNEGYRSRFSHNDETAVPGYYSVLLKDYNIKAELTATERVGFHKYTFPASDSSHFIVDLAHAYGGPERVTAADLKIVGDSMVTGGRRVNAWAKGRHIYFAMKFSKPFERAEVVSDGKVLDAATREGNSRNVKGLLHFKTAAGEVIEVKVALSAVSVEGALKNLETEIPGWDFEKVRAKAHADWEKELSRASIETKDEKKAQIFYTALYHTLLAPTLFEDVDGQYRGMDNEVHQLKAGDHNYSTFSLWDTFRALHPLYTLMQRDRLPGLVNCLVRQAEESPSGVPIWPLQGRETFCMTGYHSAPVIAEAMAKGINGVDYERAYTKLYQRAMADDYRGLGYFRKLGYIPSDKEEESATKTLEYSYDAWSVAQIAKALGKMGDYEKLLGQAGNYRNLWDKSTGFVRPRLADGEWAAPFDPKTTGVSKKWRDFTEANSWQATWGAQQDPQGYINLLGGRGEFVAKLDELFDQKTETVGEKVADMTGLVGQYAHGNEPSHHIAYLYAYAGAPYKTQERVRYLLDHLYGSTPDDGVSGNEDCGQMSAWYVISSLGFYAVDPASGNYVFGTPLFDRATLEMGAGHKLVVEAARKSPSDQYIQSVILNGKPYGKAWFPHSAIADGGKIVFQMGAKPNVQFASGVGDAPPSMTKQAAN
ncbi:GH92 family glycosyl hydrolase [uncultured Paludibaculum sp.]|uniref:GH92 family glycosyl hydrolase n=1 Tax=uncultured Paludibaculum sp. TaxID=1765020 RepID=UPI002AAC20BC|nr:GH92 family glycosyl hydrolase [uncultured Paludibaculum sp.]